jgi:hypothetical protein
MKITEINKRSVLKAVGLFYITEELNNMETFDERFNILCEMECSLFTLLSNMSPDEKKVYVKLINHGLK